MAPRTASNRTLRATAFALAALTLAGVGSAPGGIYVPVPNGSFEDGLQADGCTPVAWQQYGDGAGPTACVSDEQAFSGAFSAKFVDNDASDFAGLTSRDRAVSVGQCIDAFAWFRSPDGATAHIFLEFRDAAGNRLSEVHTSQVVPDAWTRLFTPEGCAPAGAVVARIILYACISCMGTYYADFVHWQL